MLTDKAGFLSGHVLNSQTWLLGAVCSRGGKVCYGSSRKAEREGSAVLLWERHILMGRRALMMDTHLVQLCQTAALSCPVVPPPAKSASSAHANICCRGMFDLEHHRQQKLSAACIALGCSHYKFLLGFHFRHTIFIRTLTKMRCAQVTGQTG